MMTAEHSEAVPAWRRTVGTAVAVFLGAVLLLAAYAKAIDPEAFAEQMRTEGLTFGLPAMALALAALALEAGLGTALVLAVRRLWVLVPAALLSAFFLALSGRNWWLAATGRRDADASCGCFGNLVERTPAEAFGQDLLLLGVPALLAFLGRPRGGPRVPALRTAAAVLAAAAVAGFAWWAPELPLDDRATRLAPGVEVAELCAGAGDGRVCLDAVVPELAEGEHVVVLSGLEDPALTGAIDRLNDYAIDAAPAGAPSLWLLNPDPLEAQRGFYWRWGPAFAVREAPPALLRPLYRRLPRSFLVRHGEVAATWSGLPPLERLAAAGAGDSAEGPAGTRAAADGTTIAYPQAGSPDAGRGRQTAPREDP